MQRSDLSIKGLWSRYRHVNWALADQAMVSGVNFLTGILFARYLGLEEYGRFTLAWMAVLFCNSFQQAGIIAPMMSFGPKQKVEDEPAYYGAVVVQQLLWSVLCFFLLWGGVRLSGLVKPEWHIQHLGLPLSTALLAWQLQDFLRRYFFVRDQGGLAFFNDAISYLGQLTLLVVLFNWTTLDTARVLWLIAGTSALAVVVSARHLWGGSVSRGSLRKVTGRHWTFSKWLFSAEAMRWLSGNLFVVCSGYYLGAAVVGALKASQNIMGVCHILFQGLENIVPARASRIAHSAGLKSMFRYLGKVFVFGGAAVGMVAVVAILFSSQLLAFVYGHEYVEFSFVLQWYALIYLIMFIRLPLGAACKATHNTSFIFYSLAVSCAFSFVSAKPLVQEFGILGALSGILGATVLAQVTLFLFGWRKYKKYKFNPTEQVMFFD